jgi:hypothetical protein
MAKTTTTPSPAAPAAPTEPELRELVEARALLFERALGMENENRISAETRRNMEKLLGPEIVKEILKDVRRPHKEAPPFVKQEIFQRIGETRAGLAPFISRPWDRPDQIELQNGWSLSQVVRNPQAPEARAVTWLYDSSYVTHLSYL